MFESVHRQLSLLSVVDVVVFASPATIPFFGGPSGFSLGNSPNLHPVGFVFLSPPSSSLEHYKGGHETPAC